MELSHSSSRSVRVSTEYILWAVLGLFVALRFFYGNWTHLALFYDEAYYHLWSVTPDWGYYSKPPMVAWLIHAGTWLFGTHEWSVRLASPILYTLSIAMVYQLGRYLFDRRTASYAALIYGSMPLLGFNSLFITTDAPLLFFWVICLYCFVQAISADNVSRQIVWWLGVGVSCGLGLLSKYTMIMLPAGLGLLMLIVPPFRHHLRTPWPWLAALLAGAIFSPNLWWNAAHQFISFQHTSEIAHLDRSLFHPEQLLLFILAQIMVFGPVAAYLFIRQPWRELRTSAAHKVLSAATLPMLGIILLQAFLSEANANWAAPAYIGASLLVAHSLQRKPAAQHATLTWLVGVNLSLLAIFYSYPALQHSLGFEESRQNTPFHRVLGWRELVQALPPIKDNTIVVSDSRAILSYTHFYGHTNTGNTLQVASFNPDNHIGDHFDLMYPLKPGDQAILFISKNATVPSGCFSDLTPLPPVHYDGYPQLQRQWYVFTATGFTGYEQCDYAN